MFVGDEAFFRKRFRDAILEHLVPADLRDFSFFEFDLGGNDLAEVLDRRARLRSWLRFKCSSCAA